MTSFGRSFALIRNLIRGYTVASRSEPAPSSSDGSPHLADLMRVALEMTEFDILVGTLCSHYFREDVDENRAVMYGALGIFHYTVQQAVAQSLDPARLLSEHAAKDDGSNRLVTYSTGVADEIANDWDDITAEARTRQRPLSVQLASLLVVVAEKDRPRPEMPLLRGHFALVAELVAAVALQLAYRTPERAQYLAAEEV